MTFTLGHDCPSLFLLDRKWGRMAQNDGRKIARFPPDLISEDIHTFISASEANRSQKTTSQEEKNFLRPGYKTHCISMGRAGS